LAAAIEAQQAYGKSLKAAPKLEKAE